MRREWPLLRLLLSATLGRWRHAPALAGVRDAAALEALPAAARDAWRKFWEDVESLRRKAVTP